MAANNAIFQIGRFVKEPEIRQTASGKAVCKFSLAVDRPFSNPRESDFFNYVAWGKTGEFVGKHFSKGDKIVVQGYLTNQKFTDKNGVTKYSPEITVESVDFAGGKNGSRASDDDDLPLD